MDIQRFAPTLDHWSQTRTPFIFIVDFELEMPMAWPMDKVDNSMVYYDFNGVSNKKTGAAKKSVQVESAPRSLTQYQKQFDVVMNSLLRGDSFLTNLTISTPVQINASLEDVYYMSEAKYKCLLRDRFLVFSPETFVRIENDVIRTFPMKGTIAADLPDAENIILSNEKEKAEHATIVDLLRNDISMVADNVKVERFRFIDKIQNNRTSLLQVSSEISGRILPEFRNRLGSLLIRLLPAGSVSGAPKEKTLTIIRTAEGEKRGYYTGVCGYFD